MTDIYNDHPQQHTPYTTHDASYETEETIDTNPQTGKQHVIRLLLIALMALLIVGLIIFVLIPYIEMLNQPIAPPLPPAIQT